MTRSPNLADKFAQTTVELFGDEGRVWLDRLPELLCSFSSKWGLAIGPPYPLSYHYVAPAKMADGRPVVIKVGFPRAELLREIEALSCYGGCGSCYLLASEQDTGVLLLEQLRPGTPLRRLGDEYATGTAVRVMARLWRPLPATHSFKPVTAWAAGLRQIYSRFEGDIGPLPPTLVDRALRLFDELFDSAGDPVLLHGDLHHDNILAAKRAPWLAIDPKGVYGEPAYEPGAWLRNPIDELPYRSDARRLLARRLDQFSAELALDRQRIRAYAIAQAVLSAWWTIEDHGHGWEAPLHIAHLLTTIK